MAQQPLGANTACQFQPQVGCRASSARLPTCSPPHLGATSRSTVTTSRGASRPHAALSSAVTPSSPERSSAKSSPNASSPMALASSAAMSAWPAARAAAAGVRNSASRASASALTYRLHARFGGGGRRTRQDVGGRGGKQYLAGFGLAQLGSGRTSEAAQEYQIRLRRMKKHPRHRCSFKSALCEAGSGHMFWGAPFFGLRARFPHPRLGIHRNPP